ncbi:hypothetical protein GCM10009530_66680 [Microbispora corallina]|uniref:Uncharacterized protein n=1 Tax=Microbispora corallina TaxID=83302 RepID=A0ABQ4G596_9ACTN|nr:hypothetical protein [Microbispora corallina]GIH42256.1 hypothetical protein Mco01_52560 [Microbispora corallina]
MTDSGIEAAEEREPGPGSAAGGVPGPVSVQAALEPLGRLGRTPVSGHVAVFEEVLTGLEAVLASVDEPAEPAEPAEFAKPVAEGRAASGVEVVR